jgi:hypothetical protein
VDKLKPFENVRFTDGEREKSRRRNISLKGQDDSDDIENEELYYEESSAIAADDDPELDLNTNVSEPKVENAEESSEPDVA